MENFATKRGIHLHKIPPLHPESNPAETFMRPLGKAMKIAHSTHSGEKEAIQQLLNNYRNTPHPATGVSPSSMLFRDGQQCAFPRTTASDQDIAIARERDLHQKISQQQKVNSGKYRIESNINVGDLVLVRNYQKSRKFDPNFLPNPFVVTHSTDKGHCLTLEGLEDGLVLRRHPDHVKKIKQHVATTRQPIPPSEQETLNEFMSMLNGGVDNSDSEFSGDTQELAQNTCPQRTRQHNPRYFNEDFI